MAFDTLTASSLGTRLQLIPDVHLQAQADGSAIVIDDRTFSAAHLNPAARIIVQALSEPRTQQELVEILAQAAGCDAEQATAPVASIVEDMEHFGWIDRDVRLQ